MPIDEILPHRSPAFLAFADLAKPFDQVWRLPVGLLMIAAFWILLVVLIALGLSGFGMIGTGGQDTGSSAIFTLGNVAAFALIYPGIWLTLRVLHGRGIGSLIGPGRRFDWRQAVLAAAVALIIGGGSSALTLLSGSALPNVAMALWLKLLPVALVLLVLQVTAEELIFRGYLMQQLGSRFRNRLIWWVLPAVIFGCLHFDPVTYKQNAPLLVLAAFILGLISGDLTARTGNLGASVGLHFGNNVIALLFLGMPGPLSGLALYVADVDLDDIEVVRAGMTGQILLLAGLYVIWLGIMAFRRKRQLQSGGADLN